MVVDLLVPVGAGGGTGLLGAGLLGVHLGVHRVRDVVLLRVAAAVLAHPLLRAEHGLAALVLAVEVLRVLDLALLEPAPLVLVEPEEVLLPHVLGDGLRDLHEGDGLLLGLAAVAGAGRQGLGQGHEVGGVARLPVGGLGSGDGQQRRRAGARGEGAAGGGRPLPGRAHAGLGVGGRGAGAGGRAREQREHPAPAPVGVLLGGAGRGQGLGELVLAVGELVVLALVLPLVREQLPAGVQHVVAVRPKTRKIFKSTENIFKLEKLFFTDIVAPDAVDVVVAPRELAAVEAAGLVFHKLLEPVFVELFIFHVVILVFLCYNKNHFRTKENYKLHDSKKPIKFSKSIKDPL